jgi:hypothetical protein
MERQYSRRLGDMILVPEHWAPQRRTAIDPPGCGCTECLSGEYVPLDQATDREVELMLKGEIRNNTGYVWVSDPGRTL